MAKASATTPIHQGGRTLAKMGKKGKDGGGKRMNRRKVWFTDGSGEKFDAPWRPPAYPEGQSPEKVMKAVKASATK